MELFSLQGVSFSYPGGEGALRDVTMSVDRGAFLTLIGPSGSGKSTLLRLLKPALAPHGERSGEILFQGRPLEELTGREQAAKIGFVMQDPDSQLVTDKVWHELAFGLESLGVDTETIRRRTAEMASFFGIESWFHREVADLSGGQKQLLNLASVMVTEPEVLILDEPTSQLDPIAAADFLAVLGRINRELGTTVILTEHRLEEVFPPSTHVAALDRGRLVAFDKPVEVAALLKEQGSATFLSMPPPMQIWEAVSSDLPCPANVAQGRDWLDKFARSHPLGPVPEREEKQVEGPVALSMENVWFRYEKDSPDVLRGLTLRASFGEFLCILGGNGTGKSTALSLLSGARRPQRGSVELADRVSVLPQNAQMLFSRKTVRHELLEARGLFPGEGEEALLEVIRLCRLESLLDRHPYDLSGGEQQRLALAKVLLTRPHILLLDEPTKGLDAAFKEQFAAIVQALTASGVCVVMVSHDVEFCARYAHRCVLFFDGANLAEDRPQRFFSGGSFYTTCASRMARHLLPRAVTCGDVIAACGGRERALPAVDPAPAVPASALSIPPAAPPLPLWRRLTAFGAGAVALVAFGYALRGVDLTEVLVSGDLTSPAGGYQWIYALLMASLGVLALALHRPGERRDKVRPGEKLSRRTLVGAGLVLLAVPVTIWAGMALLGDRKYYFISFLVLLECMLPFALVFEGRRPRPRELTLLAALCALAVAARAAFIALPGFKPVLALVIVAGAAFGGESGFLVGAVTMLCSNMLFGQGPWTPWQMFAMGLCGLLAGLFRGFLGRRRLSVCVFGLLAAVVVYGGIMNPASVLMYQSSPTWQMVLTAYVTGFPMDILHGASTAFFLWLTAQPMLEKLERVKGKYGLMEG